MTVLVEEGTYVSFNIEFRGLTGDLEAPTTARYRIKDLTNNRIVRDWTSLPTDASQDILIAASDNSVFQSNPLSKRRYEDRSLIVQGNYSTDYQVSKEELYRIRNQRGWES